MTTSFPTRRSSALPLHEGRHDGTAEESTVPYVFACMCAMSKLERYAAKDQCKEQSHDRHIEGRQHDGIGHGEEDHQPTAAEHRSEEHTSELQSLMRISYAVSCLKKKTQETN